MTAASPVILPEGPTTFVRRPEIDQVDELAHNLTGIRVRGTVAPGREWLAEGFFTDLLRQRAAEGLIVHGPVVLAVAERATWSYASRQRCHAHPLPPPPAGRASRPAQHLTRPHSLGRRA